MPVRRLFLVLFAVLPLTAAPLRAGPADALPEGARLRLGSGHFRHPAAVTRIYPLADGKRLLTVARDARARVWDLATEKELFSIELAPRPEIQLVFSVSPDGNSLAAANDSDLTIRVWSLADGKEALAVGRLPPNAGFGCLEYSADGKRLVSSHHDRTYRFWDPAAREIRRINVPAPAPPGDHFTPMGRVNFTPDAKALVVTEDWAVRLLGAEDGKELRWFGGHVGPVASYAFSPDGKRMATVASDRAARLWDLGTGKTVARFPLPAGGGREASFSGDGKVLAVACNDSTVRVFDVPAGREVGRIGLPGAGDAAAVAPSHDGKTVYWSDGEPVLHGFELATGKDLYPATGHAGGSESIAWSPDGKRLATSGAADRSVLVWDTTSSKLLRRLPPLEGSFSTTYLKFGGDGKSLLTYGSDRTVRVWDAGAGRELRSFITAPLRPLSLAVSADGGLAAVACADRSVRVWDVAAGKELRRLEVKPPAGRADYFTPTLCFAGDNRTLLCYSVNEFATRRWDALTGKDLGDTRVSAAPLPYRWGVAVHSGDGRSAAVDQGDSVALTELATLRWRRSFRLPAVTAPGGGRPVTANALGAAVSPDGRTVAAAADNNVLYFWDAGTGRLLAERKGLAPETRLLAFSPDGKALATAGADPGALLWDVPGRDAEGRPAVEELTAEAAAGLWEGLSAEDAGRAWRAILTLAARPKEAVPFVGKQLTLAAGGDGHPIGSKMMGGPGPNMEEVRVTRAVEVLEKIGTPEARRVLEEVAKGADGHLTAEARSALARLKGR